MFLTNRKLKFSLSIFLLTLAFVLFSGSNSFANPKYASLVIDADTGVVLHQENAGKKRHPASLAKMMTLYMVFDAIERGQLRMNQYVRVSSRASKQSPSKLGLLRGQKIKVRDAVLAVIIKSANDAAVVLAEAVSGTEWQFANHMTKMAKKLGMNHTVFKNASGLHNRRQVTTAYDMARLAVALRRDYPKYYPLFNRTKFVYKGRVIQSHNRVAKTYRGADGLKTGYIRAAGFNLVTSARRSGRSVVGVVLGGRTSQRRDRHMVDLLDRAFYKMAGQKPISGAKYSYGVPKPALKPQKAKFQARVAPTPSLRPAS